MSNGAVYDNKAYGLLSEIIGWLYPRRCDKPEIRFAVFTETISQILGWATVGNIVQCNAKESVSAFFHRFCKITCNKFFGLVKNVKHLTHRIEQFLAVCGGCFIRKTRQILQFPDQMRQAKLHQDIALAHIFAIGREIIAANHPCKIIAENLNQDARASRVSNFEQRAKLGSKTPRPETFFVFFMAGFIHIQAGLLRQMLKQFIVRLFQGGLSCLGWPGWPPILPCVWLAFRGGLDELEEFFES